ncbi:winged helix-turn-helix transcriptional regulator [Variovorax paradoxus]|uniref:winged helix-turn-helix transcriptional regulator n=1 Tax=Variovorax TaxID=34072 RepID=UPI0035B505A3
MAKRCRGSAGAQPTPRNCCPKRQKALTQCLRRFERNGLILRRAIPVSPVAVEYAVTPLGRTLERPFKALHGWTLANITQVEEARKAFDLRLEA